MSFSSFTRRRFFRLLPAGVLAGCRQENSAPPLRFPKVPWKVTSTTHFTADLVRAIGGEAVQSQCFLPPGVSPHNFMPVATDLRKFHTSDMVVTHGLGLEDRWPENFEALASDGVHVVSATSAIPPERILRPAGPAGPPDPHVWTHPELAVFMVSAVEAALKDNGVMPKLADYFAARAHKLRMEFQDAMRFGAGRAGELTSEDRFLLTTHDTMQYFASAFGLEARALAPSGGKLPDTLPAELREWIRGHGVKSLFREPATDVIALRKLMEEVRVDPDHVIYTLALPAPGTSAVVSLKTYDAGTAPGSLWNNLDLILSTLPVD